MHETYGRSPDDRGDSRSSPPPRRFAEAREAAWQPSYFYTPGRSEPLTDAQREPERHDSAEEGMYGSERWARSRVDEPLHAPRTRPWFLSGKLPSMPQLELSRSKHAYWLYVVSGVAAMTLGTYTSSVLVPLFDAGSTEPSLSRHSIWREDAPLRSSLTHSGEAGAREGKLQGRTSQRRQAVQASQMASAARNNRPLGSWRTRPRSAETENPIPNTAAAEPDLDLMDIPSSPMEQRALAAHGRSAVVTYTHRSEDSASDALNKLDLLQDPGAETGTLHINSRPWAQVFIDERAVGTTPLLRLPVVVGPHRVRLVNEAFGMSKTLDLTVSAGEHITRVLSLDQ